MCFRCNKCHGCVDISQLKDIDINDTIIKQALNNGYILPDTKITTFKVKYKRSKNYEIKEIKFKEIQPKSFIKTIKKYFRIYFFVMNNHNKKIIEI